MRGFLARLGYHLGDAIVAWGFGPSVAVFVDCDVTTELRGDIAAVVSPVGDAGAMTNLRGDVFATVSLRGC